MKVGVSFRDLDSNVVHEVSDLQADHNVGRESESAILQ